ncbi:MAG: FtsX-like permease family protein [Pseudomonadota bacterium]
MPGLRVLSRWLLLGEWRAHPVRALLAVAAIAVGVALGFAIHLINAAAFNEFSSAVKSLSGQADIQVAGREPFFDEAIYPRLAQRNGVAVASPVLELNASIPGKGGALKIIGIDTFRAPQISPDLMGVPAADKLFDVLADDAVFLSAGASAWLKPAGSIAVRAGTSDFSLRVAGPIMQARAGQRLGVMDIGAAQWRFGLAGKLSRVDLKLQTGINREAFERELARELERDFPGRFQVGQPNDENQNSRNNNMSRAYRVNLTVLALVALFTGAFLVFSTQALSVMRRRSQFALLRVLGVERAQLLRQVLVEGASLGVIGALLGVAGGYALAASALHFFGGDLGAGLFSGVRPEVQFTPIAAIVYFGLGLGVALLGCLAPAYEASRAAPAVALKSGNDEVALARLARIWPSFVCLMLAAVLSQAPAIAGLPILGYLSIGLMLIGAIGLMPRMASVVFTVLNRISLRRKAQSPVLALTLARLANASGQAAIALGGVLSSFSLMVAMAIMVLSFRSTVDEWLGQILPADLYVQMKSGGDTAAFGPAEQAAIAAAPGVARAEFLRTRPISLQPDRPNVTLMAREFDMADLGKSVDLVGATAAAPAGVMPALVSEAMLDLYGVTVGGRITLPLNGLPREFLIVGAWRDYAHQSGSVSIRLRDYRALTGDPDASNVALWLTRQTSAAELTARLRKLPFGGTLAFAEPGQIRAMSLKIFDRSFAVTYLLEAIAIAIGLSGVAATFSAQTLARAKEFGMLRHVGVTKGQILGILALEGGALTALGIACGFGLGFVISLVLVYVVNPQSFHLTMQMHIPWGMLASVAAALLAASVITALASGRYALSGGPIRAVREDW